MISCQPEPLPKAQGDALATWLMRGEFELLMSLAAARADEKTVAASNKVLESQNHPQYVVAAEGDLADARKFQTFIEVARQLKAEANHYTVRLSSKTE